MQRAAIIGITPFERPDADLVLGLSRAGALGVLDLGRDEGAARLAIERIATWSTHPFGVRVPEGVSFSPETLPAQVSTVVLPAGADIAPWATRTVLVQVVSTGEARAAIEAGAQGLIAKGNESGGRIGEETSFVLLQRIAALCAAKVPVWVQGGVGAHSAAGFVAGGAAGVVLDGQLALVHESTLSAEVRAAIAAMDGSETVVIAGHRLFTRPDLPIARTSDASVEAIRPRLGGDSLHRQLLPAGQDAAFAAALAKRYHTAGNLARAFGRAIRAHLQKAAATRPLAERSPLAVELGTRYPIVQGPMTRVSDRAAFAEAIAAAGGLPFLALALMRGSEVRDLLEETRARMGERPWGAGILGFVPEDLRSEQLQALTAVPPPFAIIAGGRPSQARPLEEQGTRTFLHVPSPGLLDLFLADGARRFIFEGRECGGHVGPRSSAVLWEQQITRLLAHDDPSELSVLFAGGIHDGRSAAMVSAMAAPLAAAGARIGVLMGTAYLFTEEAVASGAIVAQFQRAAIDCTQTVLLETAPGHATRVAPSPYTGEFVTEKARLQDEGAPPQAIWETLERSNVGRLRIASKGLVREGDSLAEVDEDEQARRGLYMMGQVAALRKRVVSMAELHADVSAGATEFLETVAPREPPPTERHAPVAIVGMAGIFPDAPDLDTFWANILAGRNAVIEVPRARWNPDIYYDAEAIGQGAGKKTPSKWGGFIPKIAFDPLAYGIPPRSLAAIEPVQLLSLEVAHRALTDAGYADRELDRDRVSVIFGAEAGTDLSAAYGFRALYQQYVGAIPEELDAHLPTLTEDSFPGVLANVIAGRIANRLDLGGVNYTVDAACAASLAAVDVAVKELSSHTSDMVLCGGADLHNSINDYLMFSSAHALSPRGRCRTFDAGADGIVLGEGVACIVLKRLEDAERDGDRIYAVIDGIAGASDGKDLGLTAPRKEGQKRALQRAYDRAGISPADVGLVEAHGTGTVVGDRTELATLTEIFSAHGAAPGTCSIGSVKSLIGHTKCAAGMAGLIKVALSLYHGVLPPAPDIETPNPGWDPVESPFRFHDHAQAWIRTQTGRRVAAVSAFGFGGTNFHVVARAHEDDHPPPSALPAWPAELFLVRGSDWQVALATLERIEQWTRSEAPVRLRDLAGAAASLHRDQPVHAAIVAGDVAELRELLARARSRSDDGERVFIATRPVPAGAPDPVAFVFPGQGSQRPGMLADLFVAFPRLRRLLALDPDVAARLQAPSAFTTEERRRLREDINDTRVAQPALGMADLAVAELLTRAGATPQMACGHSYGELAALAFAGVFDERTLIELSRVRAESILQAAREAAGDDPGTMAAVSAGAADVEAVLDRLADRDPKLVIANHNAPRQVVLSGPTPAVHGASEALRQAGLSVRSIPVACAFHSPLVAGAREGLAAALAGVSIEPPSILVFSNDTATPYPRDTAEIRARIAAQVAQPVRFVDEIEAMYEAGARIFVEVGPGSLVTRLVSHILGERPHVVVPCDSDEVPGLRGFVRALARLSVLGVAIDSAFLFAGRDVRPVDLAGPAPRLGGAQWWVDGHRAWPIQGELPQNGMRPVTGPVVTLAPAASAGGASREGMVMEFLRSSREILAAQRDIVMQYLGTATANATLGAGASLTTGPVLEMGALEPPAAPAPIVAAAVDLTAVLLDIVGERTGYPSDMLDPDLDLEADLSIDSIKRVEILGELRRRVAFDGEDGPPDDAWLEQLARKKTLRAIAALLEERAAGTPIAVTAASGGVPTAGEPTAAPTDAGGRVRRWILRVEAIDPAVPSLQSIHGLRFALTDDGRGIARQVAGWLRKAGAHATILSNGEGAAGTDGLIDLAPLGTPSNDPTAPTKRLFPLARQALEGGARWLVATTALGGRLGRSAPEGTARLGGAAGLCKTASLEYPGVCARVIDLDPREEVDQLARHVCDELLAHDDLLEVGYAGGERYTLRVQEVEGQAPEVASSAGLPDLDGESVVLITGGARGIAARFAVRLARAHRCRLILVGRSATPSGEDPPHLAGALDEASLRRALIGEGLREPRSIESAVARVLAAREIRGTLAAITEAGGQAIYRVLDVTDRDAFGALLDEVYADFGRLDGVLHAAGIIEDKLIRDKSEESFARVFDAKVNGAITIAAKIRPDVRFVGFYASVSGVFGSRGQVDYAAANDVLDKLALSLSDRLEGRVVSFDFGPWGGGGMVTPALAREFAERGLALLPPELAVERVLAELRAPVDAQVVFTASDLPVDARGTPRRPAGALPRDEQRPVHGPPAAASGSQSDG